MSQIIWLWNLMPAGVVHWLNTIIILVGLVGVSAGFLGRWIPFFVQYAQLSRIVGTVLLVIGVYFKGGEAINEAWREKIADLQAKVEVAEEKSKDANKKLDDEIKKSKASIRENSQAIKGEITRNAQQLDSECRVSDVAISIHNDAAQNKKPKVNK